jgi:hypothetical protein
MSDQRISKYSILVAETTRDLARMVDEELKKGWQPFGSVYLNEQGFPCQPVIRYLGT